MNALSFIFSVKHDHFSVSLSDKFTVICNFILVYNESYHILQLNDLGFISGALFSAKPGTVKGEIQSESVSRQNQGISWIFLNSK